MRKSLLLIYIQLFACIFAFAQTKSAKITGVIHDQSGKPLQSVSVALHRAKDSVWIKTAITAKDGSYELDKLAAGDYYVAATNIGFDKKISSTIQLADAGTANVDALVMEPATKGLGGVTVTAKRPFIETKIDKTVVNVEASPTSAGATALEVLEKSPGISVDNDGNISLRGKAGVTVMIDGKPTYLSATDLANMLKNMPASQLDQVEIMTNPSAKFDAAGNSGVINIKTKKGRAGGFNGSVMVGVTTSFYEQNGTFYVIPKSQNSINFNYRKNKINFFGNYNPNINNGRSHLDINRLVLDQNKNITGYNDVETNFKFGNNNHTLKLGLDYAADKKNTFGIVVSGFTFAGHPTPTTTTTISDANHSQLARLVSKTNNDIKFRNLTSNFNYRHVFDTTGRELTVDLDFIAYDNLSDMQLNTDFFNAANQPSGQLLLQGHLPSNIQIYSVKSDYSHPLKNGARFEAGIKSSYVKNDNVVDYTRWDGLKWSDDARSNHFIYDENINAAYVNLNKQIKKWSFQGGLRLENTVAKGYQVTNDSTFKRNFTNLFPTAYISYEVNKKNQLTVSYGRRINRPNYQDLNPFIYFLDSLSYRKGNPFLLPQFTNNIELSYAYKGKYIATVNYNNTTDVLAQVLRPEGNIVYQTTDNVARFRNMGLAITAPFTVTKWWNINFFGNVFNNKYSGIYDNQPLDVSFTSFMLNMTQSFTIKQGFTAELSGFYRAKGVDQLMRNDPMYMFGLAAQKQILKTKGTLRLNLRDPLWLQKYGGHIQYGLVDSRIRNRWDNRSLTVSFTYRFGKTLQQAPPRRRNGGSQDEQNRVGQGQ